MLNADRLPARVGSRILFVVAFPALVLAPHAAAQTTWTYTPPPVQVDDSIDTTGNPLTIDVTTGGVANSGVISGSGSVTKIGPGLFETNTVNPFSGGLTVEQGRFSLLSPGAMPTTAPITFGSAAGSDGWLMMIGADASIGTDELVRVGVNGDGILSIFDGAEFINSGAGDNDGGMLIAGDVASTGLVALDGADALLRLNGFLTVGEGGEGSLNINGGGRVEVKDVNVGLTDSATGTIILEGPGSELRADGDLNIGNGGTGHFTVSGGGQAVSALAGGGVAGIGNHTGTGTVTVTGAGSSWTSSDVFHVGRESTGILNVLEGGVVEFPLADIGSAAGAAGTLKVDGPGSRFRATEDPVYVAFEGEATVNLSNGGALHHDAGIGDLVLAVTPGSVAALNIGVDPDGSDPLAPPGIVDVSGVAIGNGSGEINFNHAGSDYFFTRDGSASGAAIPITGAGALNVLAGQTTLIGEQVYSGPTSLTGGVLRIDGSAANSDLILSGGVLVPVGSPARLDLASLDWNDGIVSMRLGADTATSDQLRLGGALQGGSGLRFDFADNGWADGQTYDVLTFGSTTTSPANFATVPSPAYSGSFSMDAGTLQFTLAISFYSIGGTVSGLSGTGLALDLNGQETLPVASEGSFQFATELEQAAEYTVTVATQPSGQVCDVARGSGSVSGDDVADITVSCIASEQVFSDRFELN